MRIHRRILAGAMRGDVGAGDRHEYDGAGAGAAVTTTAFRDFPGNRWRLASLSVPVSGSRMTWGNVLLFELVEAEEGADTRRSVLMVRYERGDFLKSEREVKRTRAN